MKPKSLITSFLKFGVILLALTLALLTSSMDLRANESESTIGQSGSCIETGACGTTPGGVKLNGYWRENN